MEEEEDEGKDPCEICHTLAETIPSSGEVFLHQNCPRCGEFMLTDTAASKLRKMRSPEFIAKLSGHVRARTDAPLITDYMLSGVNSLKDISVVKRAEHLLLEARRGQKKLGDRILINEPRFMAASYSQDIKEVGVILNVLKEKGLMKMVNMNGGAEILSKGYEVAGQLEENSSKNSSIFDEVEATLNSTDGGRSVPILAEDGSVLLTEKGEEILAEHSESISRGFSDEFSDAFYKSKNNFSPSPIPPNKPSEPWRLDLRAPTERMVILSNPKGIIADEIKDELSASRTDLENLKEMLNGLVGMDTDDGAPEGNLQVAPMAEEDLAILRSMVAAAIEAESSPVINQGIGDFLASLFVTLNQAKDILDATNDTLGKYTPLIATIGSLAAILSVFVAL